MAQPPATLRSEYGDFGRDLRRYFLAYGGVRKIAFSPYTHLALITTGLCYAKWHGENWTVVPMAVLPALLGFTLAAYALLLGFGDESFRKLLASNDTSAQAGEEPTEGNMLMGASAVFLHFVIVEVVALILAIVGESNPLASLGLSNPVAGLLNAIHVPTVITPHRVFAFVGILAFNLSVFTALAAAIDIFHVVGWYVGYANTPSRKP